MVAVETLLGVVGSIASISGLSAKDFLDKGDKRIVEKYIEFLSLRDVLNAKIDDEVFPAVIKSIEEITAMTERVRFDCKYANTSTVLSAIVISAKKELRILYKLDQNDIFMRLKMFRSIQRFRRVVGNTLAVLCGAYNIDPKSTDLCNFILHNAIQR